MFKDLVGHSNSKAGIILKIISCMCFAIVNVLVRYVTSISATKVDYAMVVFVENMLGIIFLIPFLLKNEHSSYNFKLIRLIRVVTASLGLLLWYKALSSMPVAVALSIGFVGPIFSVIGATIFLKESFSKYRAVAIILSILGMLIITRPDKAIYLHSGLIIELGFLVLLPIASSLFLVGPKLTGRYLTSRGESAKTLTFQMLLCIAPISFFFAYPNLHIPSLSTILLLIIIAIFSLLAFVSLEKSYAYADVIYLMPFGFPKFFFSAVLAFLFINESPFTLEFCIGTFVLLSSIILLSYEKKPHERTS